MHDEMRRLDDDCLPRNVLLTQGALRLFARPTIYGDTSRRDGGEAAGVVITRQVLAKLAGCDLVGADETCSVLHENAEG